MDLKTTPEFFQYLHLLDSIHVDPGNGGLGGKTWQVSGSPVPSPENFAIVFHDGDAGLLNLLLPDVHQGARRQTGFVDLF